MTEPKPECRTPKESRMPRSEGQSFSQRGATLARHRGGIDHKFECRLTAMRRPRNDRGVRCRHSAFFRISDFGLRDSGFRRT